MTITAGDLDSSAFNIQGVGFATGLQPPLVGCRDSAADNFNIDTGGVYGAVGAVVIFNTHSNPGDPNECLYTGCMDPNSSSFFSTVYNGNTYYATTPGSCDYEGCNDPLAYNFNTTCSGYVLPSGTSITITNNGCCTYPDSWDCDTVNGGCTTVSGGTGAYFVCHDFYDPTAPANTPAGCYATPIDAQNAACTSGACPACGSSAVTGCTNDCAPNYDPLATCDDGSCTTAVYGCMDNGSMTAGQVNSSNNSIWPSNACLGATCNGYDSYDSTWSYIDLTGTELNTNLGGDIIADNYSASATHMDCSCEYHGCTDSQAINYESFYTHEDGSCIYAGCTDPTSVNGVTTYNHPNPSTFYTNPIDATVDDGSCVIFGCNPIDTPNVAPWNGNSIKETMINDNAFEKAIESWNEGGLNTQMAGLYYGHAGNFDDTISPLAQPGTPSCGIPSTFANNLNNIVDYGNGLTGTCTITEYLSHMAWEDNTGSYVYDGLSCTQGFANAWGPFDDRYWAASGGHNDGFYLKRFGFPQLTNPPHKTMMSPIGQDITDLSGIQDFALNPAFKRLVIHNQYITSFIHSETDPSSPYYQLDMLDTLFQHAPNFDFLSLKSCSIGSSGEVLDLTNWTNCKVVELVDLGYDEVNINHIDNPNCHSIFIVNDLAPANDNGNLGNSPSARNERAAGHASQGFTGYSKDLNINWNSHTPGTIPTPTTADADESYRQVETCGYGYSKSGLNSISGTLVGKMYYNVDDSIGAHFPPQGPGFTGWDPNNGFATGPADRFVPQYKLAPIVQSGQNYGFRNGNNLINTRRGSTNAFPDQVFPAGLGSNRGANTVNYKLMWNYQGNIHGFTLGSILLTPGGQYHNGFGWVDHPSTLELGGNPHDSPVGLWYGPGTAFPNYSPPDPNRTIDLQLAYPKTEETNFSILGTISQSQLILINLKNLRHVWLGPDWDPQYAMNTPNVQPAGANFGVPQVNPKRADYRSFSIKGCGNGQPVYVHTDGRAMEFKKRYGTNDQTALNQFGDPIWTPEAETFFLMYFDSNVVFVD